MLPSALLHRYLLSAPAAAFFRRRFRFRFLRALLEEPGGSCNALLLFLLALVGVVCVGAAVELVVGAIPFPAPAGFEVLSWEATDVLSMACGGEESPLCKKSVNFTHTETTL